LKWEVFFGRKNGFSIPEYLKFGRIHPFYQPGGRIGTRAALMRTMFAMLFSAKREKT